MYRQGRIAANVSEEGQEDIWMVRLKRAWPGRIELTRVNRRQQGKAERWRGHGCTCGPKEDGKR